MLSKPSSGYDLKKAFGESINYFWSAELSQIYPALKRLEEEGHLRSKYEPSDKGPRRKVYHRTDSGRNALVEWLNAGPSQGLERLSFLAQVFFLDAIPVERRIWFLNQLKSGFEAHLAELQAVDAGWKTSDPRVPDALPDEDFYPYLALRLGLLKLPAVVAWCDECLDMISRRTSRSAPDESGAPEARAARFPAP
jgi:PadR family transcriptional regulator AphA